LDFIYFNKLRNFFNINFQEENVEGQQQQQSPFVLTNSPERSESDNNFDIEETENWLLEQENLRKQQKENREKLARMTEALLLGSAEDEAQIDEEIQQL